MKSIEGRGAADLNGRLAGLWLLLALVMGSLASAYCRDMTTCCGAALVTLSRCPDARGVSDMVRALRESWVVGPPSMPGILVMRQKGIPMMQMG